MKTSYVDRAQKFIRIFFPYIKDYMEAETKAISVFLQVNRFNLEYRRKVIFDGGCTRRVFITSDYVIKIDKQNPSAKYAGNCKSEYNMYTFAREKHFDYLFAPITPFKYSGYTFYIMPRIHDIREEREESDFFKKLNEEEKTFIKYYVCDIHGGNFGFYRHKPILIDYAWHTNLSES